MFGSPNLNCSVVRVKQELRQGNYLRSSIPSIRAVDKNRSRFPLHGSSHCHSSPQQSRNELEPTTPFQLTKPTEIRCISE